ncbi:MAG: hypothetical protein AMS14_08745 [Planctomycetes bacterium DG_20]|nr:MAG: hypothetical protein AMS14_08745 [Planctomycetes bacterium DG_20]
MTKTAGFCFHTVAGALTWCLVFAAPARELLAEDAGLATDPGPSGKPAVVYFNDFEKAVGTEWSNRKTEQTPRGKRRLLGRFGNREVRLSLTGLRGHRYLRISFDLFIIGSWEGTNPADRSEGDTWSLKVKDGPELLHCTFANIDGGKQTFPDNSPGPLHAAQTGTDGQDLGYKWSSTGGLDSVYRLSWVFLHGGRDITFVFAGRGLQGLEDESWGLDNVKVEALPHGEPLDAGRLAALWRQLGEEDPFMGCRAICPLVLAGNGAAAFLAGQFREADLDRWAVARLIADLDADDYRTRDKVTADLLKMGSRVKPLLREAYEATESLEVKLRIEAILTELEKPTHCCDEPAGRHRALRVLTALRTRPTFRALRKLKAAALTGRFRDRVDAALADIADDLILPVLAAARSRTRAGDFSLGQDLLRHAADMAVDADYGTTEDIHNVLRYFLARQKVEQRLSELTARLKWNPRDLEAREELVWLYLAERDALADAARHLRAKPGSCLAERIRLARAAVSSLTAPEARELARWYESLAGRASVAGKPVMLRRARMYHRQRLAKLAETPAAAVQALKEVIVRLRRVDVRHWLWIAPTGKVLDLGNGARMKLVLIPCGEFTRDSGQVVTISRPFYLGVGEVTLKQYEAVMGHHRSRPYPHTLHYVSWDMAGDFCKRLSARAGKTVRLPTEAEWEHACRTGSQMPFCLGDDPKRLAAYARHSAGRSGSDLGPGRSPDALGLREMHGGQWEWCSDYHGSARTKDAIDPSGPANGGTRVVRGRSFTRGGQPRQSATRWRQFPKAKVISIVFRVVVETE